MEAPRTVSSAYLVWTFLLLLKRIAQLQFAKFDQNNNTIHYNEAEKELKAVRSKGAVCGRQRRSLVLS